MDDDCVFVTNVREFIPATVLSQSCSLVSICMKTVLVAFALFDCERNEENVPMHNLPENRRCICVHMNMMLTHSRTVHKHSTLTHSLTHTSSITEYCTLHFVHIYLSIAAMACTLCADIQTLSTFAEWANKQQQTKKQKKKHIPS